MIPMYTIWELEEVNKNAVVFMHDAFYTLILIFETYRCKTKVFCNKKLNKYIFVLKHIINVSLSAF